ncbi:MAG: hypothetical protein AAF959_09345 [Cyanobacteria bacterium P01_D01_bin.56]
MLLLKLLRSTDYLWKMLLGSMVAIALVPAVAHAQNNQSDVTGPNLSDVTGPNLSDVTGPNQSDNTGILGEEIFQTAGGDFVTFGEFFQDFFDTYGDEFGLDPDDSLKEKLKKVSLACSNEDVGTRRFARNPGPSAQPSMACSQFSQLVEGARESIASYRQARNNSTPVNRRIW